MVLDGPNGLKKDMLKGLGMDARENHLGKFYLFSPSLRLGTTTYIQESIEGKHVG